MDKKSRDNLHCVKTTIHQGRDRLEGRPRHTGEQQIPRAFLQRGDECVLDEANSVGGPHFTEDDLSNVKAKIDLAHGVLGKVDPGSASDALLFASGDGLRRCDGVDSSTGLHLDEHHRTSLARDKVYLAEAGGDVHFEDLEAPASEVCGNKAFSMMTDRGDTAAT